MLVVLQWCCTVLVARAAAAALNDKLLGLRHAYIIPEHSPGLDEILRARIPIGTLVDSITRQAGTPVKEFIRSRIKTYPSQAQAQVRGLARSYQRLNEMIREMSDANGWVVMAILASASFRLMVSGYYMLVEQYSTEHNQNRLFSMIMFVFWIITNATALILTIEPCHRTHTQIERTEVLLSQLIVHLGPENERLFKELQQFSKQLALNSAKFTPLGVYTLARPLMATILGGVTTYLVIIIQFQKVSNLL